MFQTASEPRLGTSRLLAGLAQPDAIGSALAGIELRPIGDGDRDFLAALFAAVRRNEVAATGWPAERQQAFLAEQFSYQQRYYRAHFADADFLLLMRAGRPIGRLYAQACNGVLTLIDISLIEAVRGQGIGSALLQGLVALADGAGLAMSLAVEPDNPARRLYERHGFAVADASGFYLRMLRPAHAPEAA
ncbi:GNAT family N-acetyltransferase [Derxia lacustris]|uniref:GNAT family N-acetyltransferase n=1 Tax=Derxia lacustris TaxID=764842 RepID=UPI001C38B1BB|nr:GNAT family N-acetyltransferase [Derxia lacustris]